MADLVIVNFSVRIGGITSIALSRMDTLGGLDKVRVCVAYDLGGKITKDFPASLEDLARAKPVYTELSGWRSDISHIRDYNDLPEAAKEYVEFIEAETGVKVGMIGVAPIGASVLYGINISYNLVLAFRESDIVK